MNMQIVILVLIFLAVTGLAMSVTLWFGRDPALRQRLNQLVNPESKGEKSLIAGSEWQARVIKAVGPMAKLSTPKVGWDESSLRVRFMQAGLRETAWPAIYFAAKTVLALLWPGLFVLYQGLSAMQMTATNTILVLVLLTALGYYLPNVLLANLIKHRKREVEDALPDALDMMLVCVEAGLGLDAAMNRAASEIGLRSEAMADELNLVALELRMGVKRDQALRNMALRTGVDDVASFVAMLVQADRFGTNVADALRIEAETMRTHRRLRAEERAAKIPLKLLFPLIFFIFPSLMLVLLGPAMISIYRVLLPTMSGG
ncbi:type II secretion system F family protein [Rhodoferax sp.]|uniref:type II secretion system F family protein n=1 Tax=Rhodoferax sp. TaxID=50421 RepID=UPI0027324C4A|nr:type II secretion system F family protein [Rhodoferax sp.]MDP3192130.1 type II secretion system F family protein [Rhodoferax sp.]MDP3335515.1 type II secretion system F family protein [Rhodoferax sp.]MDP3865553.1 type II secretion system F family protein [Rhodoferax sp.]